MSDTPIHATPPTLCGHCGALLAQGGAGPSEPDKDSRVQPGDLIICLACINVLQLDADLRPQVMTEAETEALRERNPELVRRVNIDRIRLLNHMLAHGSPPTPPEGHA